MLTIVVLIAILIALLFNFLNGMNDAANAISTVIATKVFTPFQAVCWAALWNFAAYFIFNVTVAETMGSGIAEEHYMTPYVILSALLGAAIWVAICTKIGMPISTSHALIGGIIGPVWFVFGSEALMANGIMIILLFIVLSPILGFLFGYLMMCLFMALLKNCKAPKVNKVFKKMQLISSAAFSLGHGANDAQKTMGIIAILIFSTLQDPTISDGFKNFLGHVYDIDKGFHVPDSIAIACYLIMSMGTLLGGSNVIKTLGTGLAKLKPTKGFCAECAGAFTLISASLWGIPVSTTHTITGSIIGVGVTDGVKSVKWATAKNIVWAWILTIPAPLLISGLIYLILHPFVTA